MKRKTYPQILAVLTIIVFLDLLAGAQVPCASRPMSQPGLWKQRPDSLANADVSYPKAQYPAALSKARSVAELVKAAVPRPAGVEPAIYRTMDGRSYIPNGPLQYGLSAMIFGYYCGAGKLLLGGETETWIYINFNGLYWLANDRMTLGKEFPTADRQLIFYEPRKIGDIRGHAIVQPKVHNDRKEEAMILTPDGRSPYRPISREEFLMVLKKFHQKRINSLAKTQSGNAVDPDELRAKLEREKILSPEQIEKMVQTAEAARQRSSGSLAAPIKLEEDEIARIDDYVSKMRASDRTRQAVVRDTSARPENLFVSDNQGERLVTFDKSIFDPSLPRDAIQMIVVYWSWDDKDPAKSEFIREFKQNFDLGTLETMLRK